MSLLEGRQNFGPKSSSSQTSERCPRARFAYKGFLVLPVLLTPQALVALRAELQGHWDASEGYTQARSVGHHCELAVRLLAAGHQTRPPEPSL